MRPLPHAAKQGWFSGFWRQTGVECLRHLQRLLAPLWDWQDTEDPDEAFCLLPQVKKEDLIAALRSDIDCTLERVADAINSAASGQVVAQSSEPVHVLLVDLLGAALAAALRLRTHAARAGFPVSPTLPDSSRVPSTDRSPLSGRLVEMVGEAIKDTVLDLGADGCRNPLPVVDPLPPMSQKRFIKTMRPVVVAVLRKTADFINESPDQRFVASEDQRINRIFLRLIQTALQVGVGMRADAVEPKFKTGRYPYSAAPLTKWARRYRLMAVGGPEWQPPGARRGRRVPVTPSFWQ